MLSQRAGCATITSVHVLLVAAAGSDPHALAGAWRDAAPRCAVEPFALPPRPSEGGAEPAGPPAGRPAPGVFVPTTALGLSSVTPPPPPPEVARLRAAAAADLVVVHVAVLDADELHEGAVARAAEAAAPHAVPVVVLAGRDLSTRREWSAAGVSGVHEVGDEPLAALPRVARTWAPAWA
ncbi:hypothetical protein L600_003500000200 [Isoptericola variabilis J7]|nr:hypothetical protein L600_003500000200 [Isoptericola variabilis J7]